MSRTDIIADAITIIRNGYQARKSDVFIPYSKLLMSVCQILKDNGYIENLRQVEEGKKSTIKVYLAYIGKRPALQKIIRISRPGRRVYVSKTHIPNVLRGKGLAIVSTSKGLFTALQAKESKLGGEVLLYAW